MTRLIRRLIAKARIKKALQDDERSGHIGLENLETIMLVLNLDENRLKDLKAIEEGLRKECKKLKELICVGFTNLNIKKFPANYLTFAKAENHILIDKKYLGYAYKPKRLSKSEAESIQKENDLLVVLNYNEINIPIRRFQTDVKSKFKVGYFADENKPHFDFMLSTDMGSKAFLKEMLHYLKMIR